MGQGEEEKGGVKSKAQNPKCQIFLSSYYSIFIKIYIFFYFFLEMN